MVDLGGKTVQSGKGWAGAFRPTCSTPQWGGSIGWFGVEWAGALISENLTAPPHSGGEHSAFWEGVMVLAAGGGPKICYFGTVFTRFLEGNGSKRVPNSKQISFAVEILYA